MVYDKSRYFGSHLSNCPPNDARPTSGTVYYLVRNNPPKEEDFKPLLKKRPNSLNGESEHIRCRGHGLSVLRDIDDAKNLKKSSGFRDAMIAVCELTSKYGVVKKTPSNKRRSHQTLWVPYGVEIWLKFQVISE